jgi:two-component system CAI-1 autoinducer sensor kinase/phosphatase CqsS
MTTPPRSQLVRLQPDGLESPITRAQQLLPAPVMRIAHSIGKVYRRLVSSVVESAEDAEPKLVVLGLLCTVGFPLYYVLWAFVFPQPYENLGLRIAGMCIAAPALFIKRWPKSAHRYVAGYWYVSVLLCAPFFFTFMLLQNEVNTVWSTSLIVAVTLVLLVFDLFNAILMLILGAALAFAAYGMVATRPIPWHLFLEQLPIYAFATLTVTVFNQAIARETRGKIAAAMALGGHIAHELRTPLVSMRAAAEVIEERLPRLLESGSNRPRDILRAEDRHLICEAPRVIAREVDHAFMVINLALVNTGIRPYGSHELKILGIISAVESAIERYPFKDPGQRNWIRIETNRSFNALVIPVLLDHLIFNLLKNAIYAIQAAGRTEVGEIHIRAEPGARLNRLHVQDNGIGIPAAVIGRIFNPFFSTRTNGTGLGLHFCRTVMTRFGGEIACRSEPGRRTELVLAFPAVGSPSPSTAGVTIPRQSRGLSIAGPSKGPNRDRLRLAARTSSQTSVRRC